MTLKFSRRDFLRYSSYSLGAMAAAPTLDLGFFKTGDMVGRIAKTSISIYNQPDDTSLIVGQRFRDELVNLYEDVVSDKGPGYNPLWYRVWNGYIHSAHVVKVKTVLNEIITEVPKTGQLVEVTVPYSQSYHYSKRGGWRPLYRLYYGSLHWIIALEEGPDGQPWYRIKDELISSDYENYFAPAEHFRWVQPAEYSPLSPDVPADKKRIEVDLSTQTMVAYENDEVVLKTIISSGIPTGGENSWETPRGTFYVFSKLPSKHMGEGVLTDDLEAYILPGVPWVSFFTKKGVGFHGTWWHNNYGMTMSHGCINMKIEEAKWVFRWTTPAAPANTVEKVGMGTKVVVT
jgi:lipoprotein-anchoring transpeptidase ErfK/SrfK